MNLNDFLFILGLTIVFAFSFFCIFIIVSAENQKARKAHTKKLHRHKPKHYRHVLKNAYELNK